MSADLAPTFQFLAACLPGAFIIPKYFGILECLSCDESGKVSSLEKKSAHSVVHNAIEDACKAEILEKVIGTNPMKAFTPLLFGDSSTIRQFIATNLVCSEKMFVNVEVSGILIRLDEIASNGARQKYPENQLPVLKILEIMDTLFVRTKEARFLFDENIEHLEYFIFSLLKFADDRGYDLTRGGNMFSRDGKVFLILYK